MRWNRLTRLLGLGAVIFLAGSAFTPVWKRAGQVLAPPAAVDSAEAIVVLAAGMSGETSLGEESQGRTFEGVRLYQRGLAPLIVFSGGGPEAEVRARLARDIGIPAYAILLESNANTTREESRRIARLLHPRRALQILLVTESLHMLRAMRVFEAAGF